MRQLHEIAEQRKVKRDESQKQQDLVSALGMNLQRVSRNSDAALAHQITEALGRLDLSLSNQIERSTLLQQQTFVSMLTELVKQLPASPDVSELKTMSTLLSQIKENLEIEPESDDESTDSALSTLLEEGFDRIIKQLTQLELNPSITIPKIEVPKIIVPPSQVTVNPPDIRVPPAEVQFIHENPPEIVNIKIIRNQYGLASKIIEKYEDGSIKTVTGLDTDEMKITYDR